VQPEAPLKLNLVAVGKLAKTIAMEKEVFDCFDAQSTLSEIRDVETFIEIVERADNRRDDRGKKRHRKRIAHSGKPSRGLKTLSKRVDTATCRKNLTTGRVACATRRVPLGVTNAPLAGCTTTRSRYPFEPLTQPAHPVEMSTTVLDGRVVKTVKDEKEVFDCAGRIADVYLFTEIVEAVDRRGSGFEGVARTFDGVICFKDEVRAQITACRLFTPRKG
jgi:hypothetical protein